MEESKIISPLDGATISKLNALRFVELYCFSTLSKSSTVRNPDPSKRTNSKQPRIHVTVLAVEGSSPSSLCFSCNSKVS